MGGRTGWVIFQPQRASGRAGVAGVRQAAIAVFGGGVWRLPGIAVVDVGGGIPVPLAYLPEWTAAGCRIGARTGYPVGMSEQPQPLTPDPPLPPGTPQPPDLDVDLDRLIGDQEERTVPRDDDVNPDAGTTEPP